MFLDQQIQARYNNTNRLDQQFSLLKIQEAWRNDRNGIMVKCLCDCTRGWIETLNAIKILKTQLCGCRWNAVRKIGGLGYGSIGLLYLRDIMIKLICRIFIVLVSIISVGCKTAEQRQIENYQNLKPAAEWEFC